MSIKLTTTAQAATDNGIKVLIHGQAGVGKTRLAATTGGATVIISAEGGLMSLATENIPAIEVKTLADVVEAYTFLAQSAEASAFEWIALDSLSEIAEVVLAHEKAQTKDSRQAYGALQDHMADLIRSFRDLPKNVYMICKQERIKDEQTGLFLYQPMLPGAKLAQGIPYFFDEVFAYRVEPSADDPTKVTRMLQTQRDYTCEAKDRSGRLDMYEVPNLAAIRAKILVAAQSQPPPAPELARAA